MCWTLAGVIAVAGCENGYVTSGAHGATTPPNARQAYNELQPPWRKHIEDIIYLDRPPPPGVNIAILKCDAPDLLLFNTAKDASVETFKRLLVHETYHLHHNCKDDDDDVSAGEFVRCWAEGGEYNQCIARARAV